MRTEKYFTIIVLVFLVLPSAVLSESQLSIQVGAKGDDAARGNLGVQAEILTHVYDAMSNALDYFWVGTVLQDGAFAQFGYSIEPGVYCLKGRFLNGEFQCLGGTELLANSDARWQWQYWPNLYANDFFYQIGPAESAGSNGTWHLYSIGPSSVGRASFALDGSIVSTMEFPLTRSEGPPMMVAEKAGSGKAGDLGPVEFRNLSYLEEDGWHRADSLVSLSGCGINTSCNIENPYGVTAKGPNYIIAGSGVGVRRNGELLWTSGYVTLNVQVHPRVEFHIATILGDQQYTGNASVSVPRGLDAHVSLEVPAIRTEGLFGFLGVNENFQGWTGDVSSRNQSVLVLMSRNKTIVAMWRLDLGWLTSSLLVLGVLVAGVIGLKIYKQLRRSAREGSPRQEVSATVMPKVELVM